MVELRHSTNDKWLERCFFEDLLNILDGKLLRRIVFFLLDVEDLLNISDDEWP